MNPNIRIVHLNLFFDQKRNGVKINNKSADISYPTMGIRLFASIGNKVPPTEEPAATYPIANPLRFLNQ